MRKRGNNNENRSNDSNSSMNLKQIGREMHHFCSAHISDESCAVFARISSPSVIAIPEYQSHKTSIRELERNRASSRKPNWMSGKRRVVSRKFSS